MDYMNHYTKSILLKECDRVLLSWLEKDYCSVEGVSKDQAKKIVEQLKAPKAEYKPFVPLEDISPCRFNMLMSIVRGDTVDIVLEYLKSVGVVAEYNIQADTIYPVNRASFSFYLYKSICADGYYSAATKITNGLIKKLGMISPDYRISFTEVTVC